MPAVLKLLALNEPTTSLFRLCLSTSTVSARNAAPPAPPRLLTPPPPALPPRSTCRRLSLTQALYQLVLPHHQRVAHQLLAVQPCRVCAQRLARLLEPRAPQ
eukprot:350697-Chlamydomonas_euryale.AAC.5